MNKRVLVRPLCGHYALAPKQLDLLISLKSTGEKKSKSIDKTSVVKVPDTIPEGKEVENYNVFISDWPGLITSFCREIFP